MRRRVLVADDEVAITDLVAFTLEDAGYEVLTAYDGPQALELARREHPDLVMLDIMMPGIDGREVSRRLKSDPITASTPILLFSAAANLDLREARADRFLGKPFDLDNLVRLVEDLIRRHPVGPRRVAS
jgi:two-component system, OmpR family, alkaline phosphatase synthesis response regulator PhoP